MSKAWEARLWPSPCLCKIWSEALRSKETPSLGTAIKTDSLGLGLGVCRVLICPGNFNVQDSRRTTGSTGHMRNKGKTLERRLGPFPGSCLFSQNEAENSEEHGAALPCHLYVQVPSHALGFT